MRIAKDYNYADDLTVCSGSDTRSVANHSTSRSTASTEGGRRHRRKNRPDGESLPYDIDISDGLMTSRPRRSMYAMLAEEALLGAAQPLDPEGSFGRPAFSPTSAMVDGPPSAVEDLGTAELAATWRMGSAGTFWRVEQSEDSRDCMISHVPKDASRVWQWLSNRAVLAASGVAGGLILMLSLAAVARSEFGGGQGFLHLPQVGMSRPCCSKASPTCLACRAGLSIESFCAGEGSQADAIGDSHCAVQASCRHRCSADCLSCVADASPAQFCAMSENENITGCQECGLEESGFNFLGDDLYFVDSVPTAKRCCSVCQQEKKCSAWTWKAEEERCFLKHATEFRVEKASGLVSGLPLKHMPTVQIKLRHGKTCVAAVGDGVELRPCSTDDAGQRWAFAQALGYLVSPFDEGYCLSSGDYGEAGSRVNARSCGTQVKGQSWHFSGSSSQLKNGAGNCLGSAGGALRVEACAESPTWALLLIGERSGPGFSAVATTKPSTTTAAATTTTTTPAEGSRGAEVGAGAAGAVAASSSTATTTMTTTTTLRTSSTETATTTTTTLTLTTTTRTTTLTRRGPTLFCFSLMVSWNYEPLLILKQQERNFSIFSCDGTAVYSDKPMKLGSLTARVVEGTDLRCTTGGEFGTLLNTPIFIKVWEQVLRDKLWEPYDWIVKSDCDSAFFPSRLLRMLSDDRFDRAGMDKGIFLNNCGYGLHGPIEVISKQALITYQEGYPHCPNPPQEDVYLQACLKALGVEQVDRFNVLSELHCDSKDWEACESDSVAFHPFKDPKLYTDCIERATSALGHAPTAEN